MTKWESKWTNLNYTLIIIHTMKIVEWKKQKSLYQIETMKGSEKKKEIFVENGKNEYSDSVYR